MNELLSKLAPVLEKYAQIIVDNIEKDQQFINNPWMVFTVIPICLYVIFASIKWYFLLAPITIPIGFFAFGMRVQNLISKWSNKDK